MTDDPLLVSILLAKRINTAWGGPFVSPYDVGDLPDEMVAAVKGLTEDLEAMKKGFAQVEEIRRKWLASNPDYNRR